MGEIEVDRRGVERPRQIAEPVESLDLRCQGEPTTVLRVVQRLFAHVITSGDQSAPPFVPDEYGEHPTEIAEALDTALLVEVRDDLRVRSGREAVALRFEPEAQALEIVDLSVEHDSDASVLVVDRLRAGDEIDDAEATVTQGGQPARRAVLPGAIGAAVGQCFRHRADSFKIDAPTAAK